jgi:hypothetical protein
MGASLEQVSGFLEELDEAVLLAVDPHEAPVVEDGGAQHERETVEPGGGASLQGGVEIGDFVAEVEELDAVAEAFGDGRVVAKRLEELDSDAVKPDETDGNALGLLDKGLDGGAQDLDGFDSQADVVEAYLFSEQRAVDHDALSRGGIAASYCCARRAARSAMVH